MHLFKGLKLFREGINEYDKTRKNKALSDSVFEMIEARKCYEKAENELGTDTIEVLNNSFKFVEEHMKSKDEILVTSVAPEFNKIIEELSSIGLRKMVKMYTFDESMNVNKEKSETESDIHIEKVHGNVIVSGRDTHTKDLVTETKISVASEKNDKYFSIPDTATLAGFLGWLSGLLLVIYGYSQSNIVSAAIGITVFIILAVLKLKKK